MGVARVRHSTVVAGQDQNCAGKSFVDWGINQQGPWTDMDVAVVDLESGTSVNSSGRVRQPHWTEMGILGQGIGLGQWPQGWVVRAFKDY